jgi:citrate lyase subunit beta/citryl-CoA lyase
MTRPRRSCISVPGSSERFLAKATSLNADQVLLDLKDDARGGVAAALQTGDWGGKVRSVRVNGATTRWAYRDVADVVERAGQHLDTIILPKASCPEHVAWLDLLLGQVEQAAGLPHGRIGIEAQIEDAAGLAGVEQIAGCSPRLETLVFGPADVADRRRPSVSPIAANGPSIACSPCARAATRILRCG